MVLMFAPLGLSGHIECSKSASCIPDSHISGYVTNPRCFRPATFHARAPQGLRSTLANECRLLASKG